MHETNKYQLFNAIYRINWNLKFYRVSLVQKFIILTIKQFADQKLIQYFLLNLFRSIYSQEAVNTKSLRRKKKSGMLEIIAKVESRNRKYQSSDRILLLLSLLLYLVNCFFQKHYLKIYKFKFILQRNWIYISWFFKSIINVKNTMKIFLIN